jgi:hypothetical protein
MVLSFAWKLWGFLEFVLSIRTLHTYTRQRKTVKKNVAGGGALFSIRRKVQA